MVEILFPGEPLDLSPPYIKKSSFSNPFLSISPFLCLLRGPSAFLFKEPFDVLYGNSPLSLGEIFFFLVGDLSIYFPFPFK